MWEKKISEIEFTIFDTETTGLSVQAGDRIVEIAAVRFRGQNKIGTFESLINPGREISAEAFLVNQISSEMLKCAPLAEKIIPAFLDFAKGSILCSYNAGFDLDFLNNELRLFKMKEIEEAVVIDILKMARGILAGLPSYSLESVAGFLGIKNKNLHRAMADVEASAEVFFRLLQTLEAKLKQEPRLENLSSFNYF